MKRKLTTKLLIFALCGGDGGELRRGPRRVGLGVVERHPGDGVVGEVNTDPDLLGHGEAALGRTLDARRTRPIRGRAGREREQQGPAADRRGGGEFVSAVSIAPGSAAAIGPCACSVSTGEDRSLRRPPPHRQPEQEQQQPEIQYMRGLLFFAAIAAVLVLVLGAARRRREERST